MLQTVLVTGASSGIGEAAAVYLAQKGFRVFAAARSADKLKSLQGLAGGRISPVTLDVTDPASIEAARVRIEGDIGGAIYGLVNNAGVTVMGPVESVPLDEWRRQYETNVFGVVSVIQAFLPSMREARRGRIVNIGSVSGRIAAPFQGAYASSKHALEGVTDSLRRELRPWGVKVSLVRPGFINTPFGHQEQASLEKYADDREPYADQVAIFKAWHAHGHPSAPPPSIVAEVVHDALTAERPHSRYTVPPKMMGALMIRNLLPSAITDRIFERVNGLAKFHPKGK